jgi:hypothetical protein
MCCTYTYSAQLNAWTLADGCNGNCPASPPPTTLPQPPYFDGETIQNPCDVDKAPKYNQATTRTKLGNLYCIQIKNGSLHIRQLGNAKSSISGGKIVKVTEYTDKQSAPP